MVASGVSFSLYYLLYTRRRLDVLLDRELLAYLGIIAAASIFIWGILVLEGDYGASWGRALRDSAFAVSSIITTTGFITADFDRWDAAQITLILLMFIGGCAGSTAGDQGHPCPHYLPHDPPGRLQDDPSARGHTASHRRARGAGDRADRGPRALRGLDGDIRYSDLYRGAPGGADAALCATAVATTLNDVGPGLGQVGATESFEIVNP